MKKSLLLIVIFISILLSVTKANMPTSIPIYPDLNLLSIKNDRFSGNALYSFVVPGSSPGPQILNWYKKQLSAKGWNIQTSGVIPPNNANAGYSEKRYLTAFNRSTGCSSTGCSLKIDISWGGGSGDWLANLNWICSKEIPYNPRTIRIDRENANKYLPWDLEQIHSQNCGTQAFTFYGAAGDIDEDGAYEYTIASKECDQGDFLHCTFYDDANTGYEKLPINSDSCSFEILPTKHGNYHDLILNEIADETGRILSSTYSWNGSEYKKRTGTAISNQQ